jgi:alpha-maltose-1-phosphate synthase
MIQTKKFRLLHLLSQRPDATGSGIYVQAMIREAGIQGHSNYLLAGIQVDRPASIESLSESGCSFVRFGKGGDIPYQIVGMSDVMPYQSRRFNDLNHQELRIYNDRFSEKLKSVIGTFKPDIIHSHHLWIASSLARQIAPNLPILVTSHGSDLRQFQQCPHLQARVLSGCRQLDAVMALSVSHKKDICRLYGINKKKIHVVGAGYDDRLFSTRVKPDPKPVQLLYAGKLSHAKGVPWLLRALPQIASPPWHLHLVGSGSGKETETCLALAKRLGQRVSLYGAIPQRSLSDLLKRTHIFILPSFFEGLPLVVIEALASGCRVITNDLPGTRELVGDLSTNKIDLLGMPSLESIDSPGLQDGQRYEKELVSALRRQMALVLREPLTMDSSICNTLRKYAWPSVFDRVQRVYNDCL